VSVGTAPELRLLICDDSDDDAVLLVRHLRRGGLWVEYERAQTAAEVAGALRDRPPDLVISDYVMPGFTAEEALKLLHASGLDVPFIVVSGLIGEESAVTLMRAGAHDFVLKGRMVRLVPVVRRELTQAHARRERRAAEEALRVSEERFRQLTERIPDALFRVRIRPRLDVEYFSPAASVILGRNPEELCGDPSAVFSLVAPEDRALLRQAWENPMPGPLTIRWHRTDGTKVWTEQRAVALSDAEGRTVAFEGILRDITDQVQAAAEREALERQLHQVARLDSLGRLAGGIAHDFNNLLAVILGHTELALADSPEDTAENGVRANLLLVRQLAERGAGLTRQLLVFSRQESVAPEVVDVNEAVVLTEQVLRGAIGEDIEFVADLAPDLWRVMFDRSELERLLLNLVVNARKAMPDGGCLRIRTRNVPAAEREAGGESGGGRSGDGRSGAEPGPEAQPEPGADSGPRVRLSVADTGVGMRESIVDHVFEPFFTTDPSAGTGLGLSTAYGMVTVAGGRITIDSAPDAGTTVQVDLPAAPDAAPPAHGPEPAPPHGDGQTVLVVEDDDDVRELVIVMLSRSGYKVVAAASPEAALALDQTPDGYDAMVTDVVMPEMSGTALAERMWARHPELPVLLMSGYAAGGITEGFAPLGPVSLIRKPFTTTALLTALDQLLRSARA
jgi:two-component system, cell cycle sensor histidine kinase and response regulator CckA